MILILYYIRLIIKSDSFVEDQAVLRLAESPSIPIAKTVESGGLQRSYLLTTPDGYDKSKEWPLIVDFHGRNGTPEGQWNNSQYFLNKLGREYFVAYPLGCLGDKDETAWQGAPYANPSCDDITFTANLVNHVMASHNISTTRIYASGKSNGGGFVDTLACSDTGNIFAAFAMAAAALYTDADYGPPDPCEGERPRAILEAHGANDTTIPFGGRKDGSVPNITLWTEQWGLRDNCDFIDFTPTDWGVNTTCSCNGTQNLVQQYYVNGLGHCWPSKVNNTDSQEHNGTCLVETLDFTQTVLEFFATW